MDKTVKGAVIANLHNALLDTFDLSQWLDETSGTICLTMTLSKCITITDRRDYSNIR